MMKTDVEKEDKKGPIDDSETECSVVFVKCTAATQKGGQFVGCFENRKEMF